MTQQPWRVLAVIGEPLPRSHADEAQLIAGHLGLDLVPAQRRNPQADARCYELTTKSGVVLYVLTARGAVHGDWRWHIQPTLQPHDLRRSP